jgi:hypothetical protein
MKKYSLILTVLISSLFTAKAQDNLQGDDNDKRQEKIQALYVAYITRQLELTPEDAQKFWPVHTQFTNELKAVNANLPELDKQQATLNIKKKYQENFNRILGSKRCERFFKMNDEFKRKLLERMRKQRAEQQQRPKIKRGV